MKKLRTVPVPYCYVGLDLSLNGSAAVEVDGEGRLRRVLATYPVGRKAAWKRETERRDAGLWTLLLGVEGGEPQAELDRVRRAARTVLTWLDSSAARLVALEDHAFNAKGAHVYQLGWLHGLVRAGVVERGRHLRLYDVTTLKLMAAADAKADKIQMTYAAQKELDARGHAGPGLVELGEGVHENVADAYWAARTLQLEDALRAGPPRLRLEDVTPAARRALFERVTPKRPRSLLTAPYLGPTADL